MMPATVMRSHRPSPRLLGASWRIPPWRINAFGARDNGRSDRQVLFQPCRSSRARAGMQLRPPANATAEAHRLVNALLGPAIGPRLHPPTPIPVRPSTAHHAGRPFDLALTVSPSQRRPRAPGPPIQPLSTPRRANWAFLRPGLHRRRRPTHTHLPGTQARQHTDKSTHGQTERRSSPPPISVANLAARPPAHHAAARPPRQRAHLPLEPRRRLRRPPRARQLPAQQRQLLDERRGARGVLAVVIIFGVGARARARAR
ncbi:hypothetical protein BDY21DRAFT_196094 [Lineolata rhizophorae]|uniref:Uncharacterized protein n=1 Tax=Lineolata rhizophorae TaxID=578093 RepID=A0A6A6P540_9PEZI|nr:hypothetical protein BDY21DRAFT_196094 [Lineolata rhizophorae]